MAGCRVFKRRLSMRFLVRMRLQCWLLGVLLAGVVHGQIGGGSIIGMVRDPSGAPVPRVQVVAHCQDTNEERSATTNDEGYYEFPLLAAGKYRVRAEAQGFKKVEGEIFTLSTGTRPR